MQARQAIDTNFRGLSSYGLMAVVHSPTKTRRRSGVPLGDCGDGERRLRASGAVSAVVAAPAGRLDLAPTATRRSCRPAPPATRTPWSAPPTDSKGPLGSVGRDGVQVHLTGASAMWSDFNAANRSAMLRSEFISWPVTLAILVLAFGSLVAAGLPLMLTMVGLLAAAGSLYLGTQLLPVSIWAMNFALMFALALGIDYALFIVYRFRGALFGSRLDPVEATAQTMDTAGKAVLFSGVTVLISLSAVMLVPSPAFRSMSLGIMLAVLFVLAATLTLLPAVLARLGRRSTRCRSRGRTRASIARLASPPGASACGGARSPTGSPRVAVLFLLAFPVTQLKTAMPSIKVVPPGDSSRVGYGQVQAAFGPGATGPLQIVAPSGQRGRGRSDRAPRSRDRRGPPTEPGRGGWRSFTAIPSAGPLEPSCRARRSTACGPSCHRAP